MGFARAITAVRASTHLEWPWMPRRFRVCEYSTFCIHIREGAYVNKSELIDEIAAQAEISKSAAGKALDAAIDAIKQALNNEDSVTLVGFGTFYVGERAARTGRNPRTGKSIKIKAAKVPKFRAGKGLKDAVN
ncbi:HU family DNA-binding protein [Pseudothauera lacus]|uniref:HU family DNA-binding protein n=1 Tax=Pseudothauera lacus TaxID=2136175 RepID=UPI002E25677D